MKRLLKCFCLLLAVTVAFAACSLFAPEDENAGVAEHPTALLNNEQNNIRGLATRDFKMSEVEYQCITFFWAFTLDDLFKRVNTDAFLTIKVLDTKLRRETKHNESIGDIKVEDSIYEYQDVQVEVLQTIWAKKAIPESLTLTQNLFYYHVNDSENIRHLRKGGVYVLPIGEYKGEYTFNPLGYLFEIDDKGKINSHSDFKGFSKFDGNDYIKLVNAIKKITENPETMLRYSSFGRFVQSSHLALIEFEIASEVYKKKFVHDIITDYYDFLDVRVLNSVSDIKLPKIIPVGLSFNGEDTFDFTIGDRGLIFVNIEEINEIRGSINEYNFVHVQPDGTIKPPYGNLMYNDFEHVLDLTAEQIFVTAKRLKGLK